MQPKKLSPALAAIVGSDFLPRTEVTKKVWVYIKKHHLQDAKDKTKINPDDALAKVVGKTSAVGMFELPKLLSHHMS